MESLGLIEHGERVIVPETVVFIGSVDDLALVRS
jgi:hypothetical protein